MAIRVTCSCGKQLNAPDTAAGKKVRCNACSAIVAVPSTAAAPTVSTAVAEPPASGPIQMECEQCGKALSLRRELAGKRIKCPGCAAILTVAAAAADNGHSEAVQATRPLRAGARNGVAAKNELDFAGVGADDEASDENDEETPRRKSKKSRGQKKSPPWLWIGIGTGAVAAIALVLFLFVFKKKDDDKDAKKDDDDKDKPRVVQKAVPGEVLNLFKAVQGAAQHDPGKADDLSASLNNFVPNNAEGFLYVNAGSLAKTELGKKGIDSLYAQVGKELADFEQAAGMTIIEWFDQAAFVSVDADRHNMWLVIQPAKPLEPERFIAAVKKNGKQVLTKTHSGKQYYEMTLGPGQQLSYHFIGSRYMVLAFSDVGIKALLDHKPTGPGSFGKYDRPLRLAAQKKFPVVAAAVLPPAAMQKLKLQAAGTGMALDNALEAQMLVLAAALDEDLKLELYGELPNADKATKAAEELQKLLNFATLALGLASGGGKLPPAEAALMKRLNEEIGAIGVGPSENRVVLSWKTNAKDFLALMENLARMGAGPGRPGGPGPGGQFGQMGGQMGFPPGAFGQAGQMGFPPGAFGQAGQMGLPPGAFGQAGQMGLPPGAFGQAGQMGLPPGAFGQAGQMGRPPGAMGLQGGQGQRGGRPPQRDR